MTTYTTITDGQVDVDSPITQTLMTLMRDNPIAAFEGAVGAPRLATSTVAGQASGATSLDFTDLEEFQGCIGWGKIDTGLTIALSDDNGSTFAASSVLRSAAGVLEVFFAVDFGTGAYRAISGDSVAAVTGTLAGAGASVDALRFTRNGATNGDKAILLWLQGGDSTS